MSTISFSPSTIRPAASVRQVRPVRQAGQVGVASRRELRLTRRGRLVIFVLALLAVFAIGLAVASASAAGDHAGRADVHVVTVKSGDTLWDIASEAAAADGTQTGDMMQRLQDLNVLDDGVVYAGQQIRVPNN